MVKLPFLQSLCQYFTPVHCWFQQQIILLQPQIWVVILQYQVVTPKVIILIKHQDIVLIMNVPTHHTLLLKGKNVYV